MILRRALRIHDGLGGRAVLNVQERGRIAHHAAKKVWAEPRHGEGGRASGAASERGPAFRVVRDRDFRIGGFDLRVRDDGRQDLHVDEARIAIGHGVVFEPSLAPPAVAAAVRDGNGDEGG